MKKIIFILFISLCIIFNFVVFAYSNNLKDEQIIKVGCLDIENFMTVLDENSAMGYAAEYLYEISKYTGWKYEFVKGNWNECIQWLEEGKIDLLLPAQYSEERAENFLYSQEACCMDYTALIGNKNYTDFYYEDFERFNNLNVGFVNGNYLNSCFEEYMDKYSFSVNKVYFKNGTDMMTALKNNEIDAVVNGNLYFDNDLYLMARINYMPAYFICSNNKPEIIKSLDEAVYNIMLKDPYYLSNLHNKYYDQIIKQSMGYTFEEASYIKNCPAVNVAFEDSDYPLEWYDEKTKEYKGLYVDIVKLIEKESGLTFNYLPPTNKTPYEKLALGEADIIGSSYASSVVNTSDNIIITEEYYLNDTYIVAKNGSHFSLNDNLNIAILNSHNGEKTYLKESHPNWNFVECETIENCITLVDEAKTDIAIVNSIFLQRKRSLNNPNLTYIRANSLDVPVCLGLSQNSDIMLKKILDKAILKLDESDIQLCAINSSLIDYKQLSIKDFINYYPIQTFVAASSLIFFILLIVFLFSVNKIQKIKNKELEEKNKQLNEAYVIQAKLKAESETDAMTGLKNKKISEFLCTQYLENFNNLSHALMIIDVDDFKNVNDTYGHRVGDELLKAFSNILSENANGNYVVSRFGGDEFLIFISNIDNIKEVTDYCDTVYNKIKNIDIDGSPFSINCSIGIAVNKKQESYTDLFKLADVALYEAKKAGKNRYYISN